MCLKSLPWLLVSTEANMGVRVTCCGGKPAALLFPRTGIAWVWESSDGKGGGPRDVQMHLGSTQAMQLNIRLLIRNISCSPRKDFLFTKVANGISKWVIARVRNKQKVIKIQMWFCSLVTWAIEGTMRCQKKNQKTPKNPQLNLSCI